jgi:hypothetical protein
MSSIITISVYLFYLHAEIHRRAITVGGTFLFVCLQF